MSTITTNAGVTFTATIVLDEAAARALDAMAGYGADEFLKVFYAQLGKAYMQPWEHGLRNLLETIRKDLPRQLSAIDEARRAIKGIKP